MTSLNSITVYRLWKEKMKVINCNKSGQEINLSKVKIPKVNPVYDVIKGIYARNSNKDNQDEKKQE